MQSLKSLFLLDPEITFLNFGSFGACPKPVFDDYIKWQYLLEREPVQFIAFESEKNIRQSREALGKFVGCDADDLVLVTNPSYAVNIIAKSFPLQKGDEVLTTNLEYGACDRTWDYYCEKAGAQYRKHQVKFPLESTEAFVADFFKEVNEKTKLIFMSHLTSSTALRLPVEEIVRKAREMGIMTFVDGAHAPGQIELDLDSLGADIYTGACHKWMMTPKGCSFLYVKKELQALFDPLIISWGCKSAKPSPSQFLDYHQMNGTRDFSAFLTIPAAINFMEQHNWEQVRLACRKMTQDNALRFCNLLNAIPLSPIHDQWLGQLYSIQINCFDGAALQRTLFEKYKIEIPVMQHGEKVFLRYSINAFNTQADLDLLYEALKVISQNQPDLLCC